VWAFLFFASIAIGIYGGVMYGGPGSREPDLLFGALDGAVGFVIGLLLIGLT
jgi:hypothetical protein